MDKILKIENLSFGYDEQLVLENLNLEINSGDFIAIIGENGSGKSTLFKLILGELTAKVGQVELFDTELAHFKDWTKIGYVAQVPLKHNDFPATVKEVVRANLYSKMRPFQFYSKIHNELTLQALKKVEMEDFIDRPISKLSRGQQQRVMIARVMINNPELMLLDEPTSGVDNVATESIYELLKKLNQEEKITVVLITHDLTKIGAYVNRVVCIEGKTAYELTKEEIQNEIHYRHKHPKRNNNNTERYLND